MISQANEKKTNTFLKVYLSILKFYGIILCYMFHFIIQKGCIFDIYGPIQVNSKKRTLQERKKQASFQCRFIPDK